MPERTFQKGTETARSNLVAAAQAGMASEGYVDSAVANKVASSDFVSIERVPSLPGSPDPNILYIVVPSGGE